MMIKKIEKFYDRLSDIIMFICKLFLIADILITSVAVAGRFISFIPDPKWSEEIVLTCMIYMALISASLAIRKQSHIRMTALDKYLSKKLVQILDIFDDLLVLIFAIVILFVGASFAYKVGLKGSYTSLPWLSKFWLYLPVPLCGLSVGLFELEVIYKHVQILRGKEETKS